MRSSDLRTRYVEFFKARGHLHLPSAPLVPIDALGVEDRSTLFTSAGMQQFKPYFTGEAVPPCRRITTVQKCVRTGDIDSVGDLSHCTFFEMLGNFSFGDYFKAEVIPWTWEFLTQELKLDPDRLCVTIYLDDDEAFEVWHRSVGLPEDRIHRLGGDKNYWPANAVTEGPNGPCGPCTEVFYRLAPESEMTTDPALSPTERFKKDDEAGRWLEIWNNVFTQFNRTEDPDGTPRLEPLPSKNNDTGAGFERIVCLMQDATSVYDTDLFAPAIRCIEEVSGRRYRGSSDPADFAFRVVAEHTRTAAFCIADGVLPLNEGRGYVLRRIMRRAIRYGKNVLGMEEPFLHEVAPVFVEIMGDVYPELRERKEHIVATIRGEEERFRRTLDQGVVKFFEMVSALPREGGQAVLPGKDVFMLHDTYGFPLELTQELAREHGLTVDTEGFHTAMEERRRLSQETSGLDRNVFRSIGEALGELQRSGFETIFVGYRTEQAEGVRVLAIIRDGQLVDFARAGSEVDVVLDQTPFYAESGGQVGDTGMLLSDDGLRAEVTNTYKAAGVWLHRATVREGELSVGAAVRAVVDAGRRADIRRNHTATHLLQAALRQVLGKHVHQKGSLVAPDRLRFDFTHGQAMTRDELRRVEDLVNEWILADLEVVATEGVPLDEARRRGAMALFGEKYGASVRTIEVGDLSLELCGGTHLSRTSQAGLFKIVSEGGIAAGVRRIEAVTGRKAWEFVKAQEDALHSLAARLGCPVRQVEQAAARLADRVRELEREMQQLRTGQAAASQTRSVQVDGVPVTLVRSDRADMESLGAIADRVAKQSPSGVVAVGGSDGTKAAFVVKVSRDLVERGVHAGNLVREVARLAGGGGGGRPDFAQAGGKDPAAVDRALEAVPPLVQEALKSH